MPGANPSGLPGVVPLFRIIIPRGIGSELCEFKPCDDPVCGMLPESFDNGALGDRPLFRIVMPLGIDSELCVFTPWDDPVSGTTVRLAATPELGAGA